MTIAERFAKLSGAKLSPKSKTAVLDEPDNAPDGLAVELPAMVPTHDVVPTTEERTYVADKFDTKKPIWQRPQIKMAVIAVPALAATFGILAAMNGSFTMPSAPKVAAKPLEDDTTPKQASVGDVQGVALSRGLSTGFDKESQRKNPFVENSAAVTPTTAANAKTPNGKVVPANRPANPTMAARSYPVTRMASANAAPATDYVPASSYNRPYSPPARSYYSTPAYPTTPNYGVSASAPARSATKTVSPRAQTASLSSSQGTAAPQAPEKSAQDRRLAVIAATSSGTDTAQQSAASIGAASPAAGSAVGSTIGSAVGSPSAGQTQSPARSGTMASSGTGYQEAVYLPSEASVLDGIPQQLINRSKKAEGRLVMGLAFTPGASQFMQGQPVEVAIENPLDSGLPQGAHLIATVDLQQQGGAQMSTAPVRLIPNAITIGDAEYPLPQGSIVLTGQNGAPLVAKRQGSGFMRFVGGLAKTAVGGIGGVVTTLLGASPIVTALSPQLQPGLSGNQGTQQTGNEVLALRENSPIQINIIQPFSLPLAQGSANPVLPTDQALFPLPQSSQRMAYRDPSDAELNQIIQQQTGIDPEQQQALSQDSQAQQIEQQQELQPAQSQADPQPTENNGAQH